MVHIGEKIRNKAKENRIGSTELARLIGTSKQNANRIFKAKSVDSEMLYKISVTLDYNFFSYYFPEEKSNSKSLAKKLIELNKEVERLKKKITDNEMAHLRKVNEILLKIKVK